jgi:hypothetical protein
LKVHSLNFSGAETNHIQTLFGPPNPSIIQFSYTVPGK